MFVLAAQLRLDVARMLSRAFRMIDVGVEAYGPRQFTSKQRSDACLGWRQDTTRTTMRSNRKIFHLGSFQHPSTCELRIGITGATKARQFFLNAGPATPVGGFALHTMNTLSLSVALCMAAQVLRDVATAHCTPSGFDMDAAACRCGRCSRKGVESNPTAVIRGSLNFPKGHGFVLAAAGPDRVKTPIRWVGQNSVNGGGPKRRPYKVLVP